MRAAARPAAIAAALSLAALGGHALAQSSGAGDTPAASPNQIAQAREQYRAGVAAGQRNAWNDARQSFERAYALYPQPLTLLNLATAQVQTGRLVAGAESYRRFLSELGTGPAARYRDAAERSLAETERRIAHVRIAPRGLRPGDTVLLDAAILPLASTEAALPIDPGPHTLGVTRSGVPIAHADFVVRDGEAREVSLDADGAPDALPTTALRPSAPVDRASAPRPGPLAVTPHPARSRARASNEHSNAPWVLLGVAGGTVLVGAAIAVVAVVATSAAAPYTGNLAPGHWSLQ